MTQRATPNGSWPGGGAAWNQRWSGVESPVERSGVPQHLGRATRRATPSLTPPARRSTSKGTVSQSRDHIKNIYRNRKVFHDYTVEDRVEAGISLLGSEVKSLRNGSGNLADAYVAFRDGEAWLINAHITPYAHATHENHEPLRERKLLLGRREIRKLQAKVRERGYSLVPISMYFKGPWVKVELGLGRGKRKHDKRSALKEREDRREMDRAARDR